MKVSNFSVIKWILLLTVVFVSACAGDGEETAVLPPTPTVPSPTSVPTETATRTPSPTRPPEETAISPTSTPIPPTQVPTSTPTATDTPIALPTLPPDEAVAKVLSLLQDNQNPDCLLPCWWGATLGQTNWHDIEPFLRSVAINISERSKGAEVKMPIPELVDLYYPYFHVFYGWNESQIIDGIYVDSMNIPGYDPKTMMTLYGAPDEVWMKTFGDILPGDVLPFQLIIIYQNQGISFRYYVDASRIEDMVTVCFEPGIVETERPDLFPVSPRIWLWEPGLPKTIDEVVNTPDEFYFPLEEKTDLTPQTFYEKFTNPNESPCIDTPSDFWDY
jgi:hypothetical protein